MSDSQNCPSTKHIPACFVRRSELPFSENIELQILKKIFKNTLSLHIINQDKIILLFLKAKLINYQNIILLSI